MDERTRALTKVSTPAVSTQGLLWFEEQGMGYLPPKESFAYDASYIERYARYEQDGVALELNTRRVQLVERHVRSAPVVDVGVGSGTFIKVRIRNELGRFPPNGKKPATSGFDVSDVAVDWLKSYGLYFPLHEKPCRNATFWDSLEHATDASVYLGNVQEYAFISMPIFRGLSHLLSSKHFKPNEHVYYFTSDGLIGFMDYFGFGLCEQCRMEEAFGREDIGTFVFRRGP